MTIPFVARKSCLTLVLLQIGIAAYGGTVQTRDGRSLEGDLHLERDAVVVAQPSGQQTSVGWQDVAIATFAAPPKRITPSGPGWQSHDVGAVRKPGSTRLEANCVLIEASGWGFGPSGDALRLLSFPMPDDGQLVARTSAWHDSNGTMRAGITLRAGFSNTALHASLLSSANGTIDWMVRSGDKHVFRKFNPGPSKRWMRLTRAGNRIVGYLSDDGRQWEPVDAVTMTETNGWQAGLIGCASINAFLGAVELDHVQAALGPIAIPDTDLPSPSVVLRDGSILAGSLVPSDNDLTVSCAGESTNEVPWTSIATVVFKPIPIDLALQTSDAERTGVVLNNGDWLEGEINAVTDDGVTLTSVLLGNRRVRWREHPAAVVMAGVIRQQADWEVRLRDGSRLRLLELHVEARRIRAWHPAAGALDIPEADLLEVRFVTEGSR